MPDAPETKPIRAHLFTDTDPRMYLKQAPGMSHTVDGVDLSIGLDVADDADVLVLHTRASFSVPTRLPRERTVFISGEPDQIHRYNPAFLNQFGLVLTTSPDKLEIPTIRMNFCTRWYAGVDFREQPEYPNLLGYNYFSALQKPQKIKDRISIVTSRKTYTPYQRQRVEFIDYLKEHIPEHIDLFGAGHLYVGDKREALEPYKYHLALENGGGDFAWTEKLSDPLICWSFPFYSGCRNVSEDLPAGCHMPLALDDFEADVNAMIEASTSGRYEAALDDIAEARRRIFSHFNIMSLFARTARTAYQAAPNAQKAARERLIYAERTFMPGEGHRGNRAEVVARRAMLALNPRFDLGVARLKQVRVTIRQRRKRRRLAQAGLGAAPSQG